MHSFRKSEPRLPYWTLPALVGLAFPPSIPSRASSHIKRSSFVIQCMNTVCSCFLRHALQSAHLIPQLTWSLPLTIILLFKGIACLLTAFFTLFPHTSKSLHYPACLTSFCKTSFSNECCTAPLGKGWERSMPAAKERGVEYFESCFEPQANCFHSSTLESEEGLANPANVLTN